MPFLVTPPLPNLTVEIAFDSGFATPEGDRTWTDISDYVEGASSVDITFGRADELSTPDPNTCSLTLDNRDGRFTPAKSSSPYFPNVKKGKPLRVTVTYAGVDYIRFTGYVNEWPLVWPDSTSAAATVSISASSRRARLGQTAPLTSAIRAAYLATGPQAYWPMDEDAGTRTRGDQQAFQDITNTDVPGQAHELLASFSNTPALAPVVQDGTAGPTDETSLVRIPLSTDPNIVSLFGHYVGGGGVFKVNTAGAMTFETVARIVPNSGDVVVTVMDMVMANLSAEFFMAAASTGGTSNFVTASIYTLDPITRAVVEDHTVFDSTGYTNAAYAAATDGELHHWATTLNGTAAIFYLDGTVIGTMTMTNPITKPFTGVALGSDTYNANVWVGHAAVTNRALTAAEILAHAQAATAITETPEERVVRVAGRVGVPSSEVDVEDSLTDSLGAQSEAGRSAAEVLDELASATGGVLYDTRAGHLAMQARTHRYNLAAAFTASGVLQEIQGDLTVTDDHRYTINTVQYSRAGVDEAVAMTVVDQDSIDDYGVFAQTYTVIASDDADVEAFAQDRLLRYADPDPRVSTVSFDIVNLDAVKRDAVLSADIGTRFGLGGLANQAPTDPMYVFFEGATESITATSHTLTANTTPADLYQDVFVWDDPVHGTWDSGNVWAY